VRRELLGLASPPQPTDTELTDQPLDRQRADAPIVVKQREMNFRLQADCSRSATVRSPWRAHCPEEFPLEPRDLVDGGAGLFGDSRQANAGIELAHAQVDTSRDGLGVHPSASPGGVLVRASSGRPRAGVRHESR